MTRLTSSVVSGHTTTSGKAGGQDDSSCAASSRSLGLVETRSFDSKVESSSASNMALPSFREEREEARGEKAKRKTTKTTPSLFCPFTFLPSCPFTLLLQRCLSAW